jgi:hypothetical protein
MKPMQLPKALILTALFFSPLAAEEVDAAARCDTAYDACFTKCDAAVENSEKCYQQCDKAHEDCLAIAQGEEPEPAAVPEQVPVPEQVQEPVQMQEPVQEQVPEK